MTAKCPSTKDTCQRVETWMQIGWTMEWYAEILAWYSSFRLEVLCCCVLSQISGGLPFNSSYLAFFAFLCADQLREWNEYSWYSGKCIWKTKKLFRGCGSAHKPYLGGGYRKSFPSSHPEFTSCHSSASALANKILETHWKNLEERIWGRNVCQIYASLTSCLTSLLYVGSLVICRYSCSV